MLNTAPLASNSVYGREKLFWYDKINFSNHVCHCGAVSRSCLHVQINRVRLPATLFSVSLYRFYFSCLVSFFNTIFPFGLFFFILTADPAGHALGSIYILSLSPEFYFWKRDSSWPSLRPGKKKHKLSRHVPPLTSWQTTHRCIPNTALKCSKATTFNAHCLSHIPVI